MTTIKTRDHLVPAEHRLVSAGTNARTHITVHETANSGQGANAAAHARLQANGNSRKASWHWTVDDHEAVRSYPHTAICWHAGNSRGSAVSIAVEICVNSDGNRAQAIRNAAALVAKIRRDENIPAANVVQHNHWSGKNCPTGLRSGVPMNWPSFLALVATEYAGGRPGSTWSPPPFPGIIRPGNVSNPVQQWAVLLSAVGYKGFIVTGPSGRVNGSGKVLATKRFQRRHGLNADGIVGPKTWAKAVERLIAKRRAAGKPT